GSPRRPCVARRDGAKMASGTYLTDASLLREQETALAAMLAQGFTVATATQAYQLLYSFIIGFCIEEQAVSQAAATGDRRYSLASRAERVGPATHPLVTHAGPQTSRAP